MPDPIAFDPQTARHGLPMLFSGQAQKEFYLNEALSHIDTLLHPSIEGVANEPPAAPLAGKSWIVGADPIGAFVQATDMLATWSGTGFRFTQPVAGMRVFDRQNRSFYTFDSGWTEAASIAEPTSGQVIDVEARAAIVALLQALRKNGTLGGS